MDAKFDPEEQLFYRFDGDFKLGAPLRGIDVRSPDFSVNRAKHGGLPDFVLIPQWLTSGIAMFEVRAISWSMESEGKVTFSWSVEHVPEEENYHHSEVHTFKAGVKCEKSGQVSQMVKKAFRQAIAERMTVIKVSDYAPL
ncbi:MAG TPA: hypothetical protein VNH18_05740 [Bryobacteraceae bacterium]|nr:hypothetical protein [Bryobacteraceae bacterium]